MRATNIIESVLLASCSRVQVAKRPPVRARGPELVAHVASD